MKLKKYAVLAFCMATVFGTAGTSIAMAAEAPKVENTGNLSVENKLNQEFADKNVNTVDEENHLSVTTTFEEKYRDEEKLSFVVTTEETQASTGIEKLYYNTNLKTGEALTLKELLGDGYKEIATQSVKEQIAARMAKDESQMFYGFGPEDKELEVEGFTEISDQQTFYLNKEGNVVITFAQFEIAPGYMGTPEFEIIKK